MFNYNYWFGVLTCFLAMDHLLTVTRMEVVRQAGAHKVSRVISHHLLHSVWRGGAILTIIIWLKCGNKCILRDNVQQSYLRKKQAQVTIIIALHTLCITTTLLQGI